MSDRAQQQSSEGGAPEWMVSYADMITIMMAFFVVLYATTSGSGRNDHGHEASTTAETGKEKVTGGGAKAEGDKGSADEQLQKVLDSLYLRFGPKWNASNCWRGGPIGLRGSPLLRADRQAEDERLQKSSRGRAGGSPEIIRATEPGEYIIPNGRIHFEDASAVLSEAEKAKLRKVTDEMAGRTQRVEIRGHTSRRPLPPQSPYRDHADLAYARCRNVQQYLVSQGVDSRRIRLGVAGENEPLPLAADSPRLKENCRVEIRLLNEWVQEPDGADKKAAVASRMAPN